MGTSKSDYVLNPPHKCKPDPFGEGFDLYWCSNHPKPVVVCSRGCPGLFLVYNTNPSIEFEYYPSIEAAVSALKEHYERITI